MAKGSAAWVLTIVTVLSVIVGALLLTVVDPLMQTLFDSTLWQSSTQAGTNALGWQKSAWTFLPISILLALLIGIWIETRQPT